MSTSYENDDMSTSIEELMSSVPVSNQLEQSPPDVIQDKDIKNSSTHENPLKQVTVSTPSEDIDSISSPPTQNLIRDAIIVMCVFWVFSSPFLYQQVNNLVNVLQPNGVPAAQGLLLHGTIAGLCYYLVQKFLL